MNNAAVFLITILTIVAVKAFFVVGVAATPHEYVVVLRNSMVIEYVLWTTLAISVQQLISNRRWYRSTHSSWVAEYIVDNAGDKQTAKSSHFSSSPDYEQAKKAFGWSKIMFTAALFGTVVASLSY